MHRIPVHPTLHSRDRCVCEESRDVTGRFFDRPRRKINPIVRFENWVNGLIEFTMVPTLYRSLELCPVPMRKGRSRASSVPCDVPFAIVVQKYKSHLSSRLRLDEKLRPGQVPFIGNTVENIFFSELPARLVVNITSVYNADKCEKYFHRSEGDDPYSTFRRVV